MQVIISTAEKLDLVLVVIPLGHQSVRLYPYTSSFEQGHPHDHIKLFLSVQVPLPSARLRLASICLGGHYSYCSAKHYDSPQEHCLSLGATAVSAHAHSTWIELLKKHSVSPDIYFQLYSAWHQRRMAQFMVAGAGRSAFSQPSRLEIAVAIKEWECLWRARASALPVMSNLR